MHGNEHATTSLGYSFEAVVQTFGPVVFHSMSGTLMPIFKGFALIFIIYVFTYFLKRI